MFQYDPMVNIERWNNSKHLTEMPAHFHSKSSVARPGAHSQIDAFLCQFFEAKQQLLMSLIIIVQVLDALYPHAAKQPWQNPA